jgi:MerR family transcriptional regulator, copper efflux regulator
MWVPALGPDERHTLESTPGLTMERMRIGRLAQASGVSADTIRYYEKIGLLPRARRTANGYREYPDGAANRIRVIRNAVQLGFPLVEIAKVLRIRDAGGAPCRQVRDYALFLVAQIEQKIAQLSDERRAMAKMIRVWDERLAQAGPSDRAHLLEEVVPPPPRPRELPRRRRR